jgi:hypothetical protein
MPKELKRVLAQIGLLALGFGAAMACFDPAESLVLFNAISRFKAAVWMIFPQTMECKV